MNRFCEILSTSEDGKIAICVDKQNKEEILAYVRQSERHLKKFRFIVQLILEGHRNAELYDKEDINGRCDNVTAMKFFKGQENGRIYCVEQRLDRKYIIIAVQLHSRKKTQKNTKREKSIIEKIAQYEYEIIES